ncbi:unnamed protein product, partial [Heterosigma akashiwo]
AVAVPLLEGEPGAWGATRALYRLKPDNPVEAKLNDLKEELFSTICFRSTAAAPLSTVLPARKLDAAVTEGDISDSEGEEAAPAAPAEYVVAATGFHLLSRTARLAAAALEDPGRPATLTLVDPARQWALAR